MHALGPLKQWTSVVFTFSIMWAAICLTRCVMTAAYRKYRTRKSTGSILLSGNSAPDYPHQDRDLCQQHQRNSKQHEFSCNCKAYRCTKSEGVPSNRRDRHGAVSCKKKATPEHIQRLEELLAAMNAAGDDPTKLSQLDFEFHSSLVRITDNELLFITFNTI